MFNEIWFQSIQRSIYILMYLTLVFSIRWSWHNYYLFKNYIKKKKNAKIVVVSRFSHTYYAYFNYCVHMDPGIISRFKDVISGNLIMKLLFGKFNYILKFFLVTLKKKYDAESSSHWKNLFTFSKQSKYWQENFYFDDN